jgi:hypothetical protein
MVDPASRILSTTKERRLNESCLFRKGLAGTKVPVPKSLYRVSVQFRVGSVARNLSLMEEQRQHQLFRKGDYRSNGHRNKKKSVLSSSPDEYEDDNFLGGSVV